MSSPDAAAEVAQIIAVAAASFKSNCILVAIIALLVYEWVIGFGKEINLFWREKITAATVLFLLNRYAPLLYFLSSFSGSTATTDKYVPWALFSCLRTYALCGKRWILAVPVLILSAVPIGINLTRFHWSHGEVVPIWGCDSIIIVPANISLMVTTMTGGFSHGSVPSIAQRLLVNGTIYFVILLVLNVLHLTFTVLSIATAGNLGDASYIVSFTEPITAILVARFMLDLQKAKQKSQHHGDSDIISMARFDRALGSIGSTLAASDVWRQGPGPTSDFAYAEGRPDDLLFMKFEPDVFGKGVVTSMILEAESTPSLEKGRVSESETV